MKISEHFHDSEFTCKCCGESVIDIRLIILLEDIRVHFGKPVSVTSGYRCEAHNRAIGGSKSSQHLKGTAADFNIIGVSPAKVQQYLADHQGGLGLGSKTFTHADVRDHKARWHY